MISKSAIKKNLECILRFLQGTRRRKIASSDEIIPAIGVLKQNYAQSNAVKTIKRCGFEKQPNATVLLFGVAMSE